VNKLIVLRLAAYDESDALNSVIEVTHLVANDVGLDVLFVDILIDSPLHKVGIHKPLDVLVSQAQPHG
jgi:hypothetical protein